MAEEMCAGVDIEMASEKHVGLRADMDAKLRTNTASLFQIAASGDFQRMKAQIENPVADLTEKDADGNSLLAHAVLSGNLEAVRYLAERCGLDAMAENFQGKTPWDLAMEMAVGSGQKEIAGYFAQRAGFAYEESIHNPIRQGFFPDPSIVRVGEDYYMVNSSFAFFPCIPISHSRDLVSWKIIGYAITNPEYARLDELCGGRGYWAPDISYSEGRFFITATLRGNDDMEKRRLQMVTSSDKPEGPYDEPVFLDIDGIDPSIFHHEDGRKFMLINKGARLVELSRDCRSVISEPVMLWYGDCRRKPEGPHMLKHGEYYYLFLAEGGTGRGHRITVARSKEMMGPYEACPYNPILKQEDETALTQCCGHGKPFQLPDGRWYLVYLGLRMIDGRYGMLGRETFLTPMYWTEDGWPVAGNRRRPAAQLRRPFPLFLPEKIQRSPSPEEFEPPISPEQEQGFFPLEQEEEIPACQDGYPLWRGRCWMTPRPLSGEKICVQDNHCFLTGTREDLNSLSCRSILVERQDAFCFDAVCTFHVPAMKEGESLGLTCYYDENSYIKYGITLSGGSFQVLLAEYVGDGYRQETLCPPESGEIREGDVLSLKVSTDYLKRGFFWNRGDGFHITAEIEDTSYLSSEGLKKGKRFTGATVGIYVQGDFCGEFVDWSYERKKS